MSKKSFHVVVASSGRWGVRTSGSTRSSKIFVSQQDALKHARIMAKDAKGELYVHGIDGTVKEKNSYGKDSSCIKKSS